MNKFMRTIFEMSTENMGEFLHRWSTFYGKKCWLKLPKIEEGTVRPLLVAHIDKSRTNEKIQVLYDSTYAVAWSPKGLGGDDRCGVYGLLRIWCDLPEKHRPILLFCDEEEKGGAGAREAAELFKCYLKNMSCMIELDRRGAKDVVFYNNESKRFKKYIEKFGFKRATGSFSDISVLGREWQLAGANVSVGFYDNHAATEIVKVHQLLNTITKITKFCIQASTQTRVWHNPNAVKIVQTKYSNFTRPIHRGEYTSYTTGKAEHDTFTGTFPAIDEKENIRPTWYKGIRSRWYGRYYSATKNRWISWEEHDEEVTKRITENKKNFLEGETVRQAMQQKREVKILEINKKTGVYEDISEECNARLNFSKFRNINHSIRCVCYQCNNLPHSSECTCEECGLERMDAKERVLNSEHDEECECPRCYQLLEETVQGEALELADLYSILKNHNSKCDCIDCIIYDGMTARADKLFKWEESLEEITDEEEEIYKYYCMECDTPMHTLQCKDCMTYGSILSEGGIILAQKESDIIFGAYIYTYYCYSCNKEFTEDYSMTLTESPECPECNMPGTFAGQEVVGKHPDFLKHGMC